MVFLIACSRIWDPDSKETYYHQPSTNTVQWEEKQLPTENPLIELADATNNCVMSGTDPLNLVNVVEQWNEYVLQNVIMTEGLQPNASLGQARSDLHRCCKKLQKRYVKLFHKAPKEYAGMITAAMKEVMHLQTRSTVQSTKAIQLKNILDEVKSLRSSVTMARTSLEKLRSLQQILKDEYNYPHHH